MPAPGRLFCPGCEAYLSSFLLQYIIINEIDIQYPLNRVIVIVIVQTVNFALNERFCAFHAIYNIVKIGFTV